MTYAVTNPPTVLGVQTGAGKNLWFYSSADDDSTVIAAGYITNAGPPNAANLGMKVGDAVLIWDSTTPKGSLAFVSAINSTTGASTMTFAAVA